MVALIRPVRITPAVSCGPGWRARCAFCNARDRPDRQLHGLVRRHLSHLAPPALSRALISEAYGPACTAIASGRCPDESERFGSAPASSNILTIDGSQVPGDVGPYFEVSIAPRTA